jgi:hypothetical protein
MEYEASANFRGDSSCVLESAVQRFVSSGLNIQRQTSSSAQLQGVGSAAHADKFPMRGVSQLDLSVTGSSLTARAELGGVAKIIWLILTICIPMDVVMSFVLALALRSQGPLVVIGAIAVIVIPTFAVIPIVKIAATRRVTRAIDQILASAASTA